MLPEEYGGIGLDVTAAMIVAEGIGKDGSYAAWHGAQTGIGTLPVLYFGTDEQKRRYLPKLATCEIIAAYCLTEAHAGSDALAARTLAELSGDGTHYVLNGQKMWITNGGAADLYTVFAKLDGKLTAFLVERGFEGVRQGAEERKMGIKGSSTCAIYFDNVRVPKQNVLGEPGRGHVIAFNILNIGRLLLGAYGVGAAKEVLAQTVRYAKERIAFGKPIAEYGLVQQKLAEMAVYLFAAESMIYRTGGMITELTGDLDWTQPDTSMRALKASEEYAAECSLVKIFASEMLGYVVDEGVQIHGGYGFHQDYVVERAYRDARINRIFEGTNEINRLLATGMLLKRAQKKQLPLVQAVKKLNAELLEPAGSIQNGDARLQLVAQAKRIVLLLMGIAYQRFGSEMEEQQEILAGITDAMMSTYALEGCTLRGAKRSRTGDELMDLYTSLFSLKAIRELERAADEVIATCSEGDDLRTNRAIVRKLLRRDAFDAISLRRKVAGRLVETGKYIV
jgi:alkylation response protein AidB-like acyl-CoA dehydrogenase